MTVPSGSAEAVAATSRTSVSASARARAASADRRATVATNHDTTIPMITKTTSARTLSRSLIVQLWIGGKKNQFAYSDEVIAVTNAGPVPPRAAAPTTTSRKRSNTDGKPMWSRTELSSRVRTGGPAIANAHASRLRRGGSTTRLRECGNETARSWSVSSVLMTWTSIEPAARMIRLTTDPDVISAQRDRRDAPITSCVACSARAVSRSACETSPPDASM